MSQLAFRWPAAANYAAEDFILSGSNALAARFVDSWPQNAEPYALLSGPAASGKTHLMHRFAAHTGAVFLNVETLGNVPSESFWGDVPYAVAESVETVSDEAALFHLLRFAESSRRHLFLTSRVIASELPFSLPDLRSRLLAMPTATIYLPDDAMLTAFFSKAFADRQWRVAPGVLNYMVLRTERSFEAAQQLVLKLDHLIATTNKEMTIPLIKPLVEPSPENV